MSFIEVFILFISFQFILLVFIPFGIYITINEDEYFWSDMVHQIERT